ncbi:MAG TPA: ABC transporter ATP-binding protein [Candidatus Dormibacteraeota bacterium]|nr:ABC transporter ATP-binding protein [Candidatus Dormibacteraeota bacterium]
MTAVAPAAAGTPVLEARAVERRYRGGRGVGPVDLHVGPGDVVVLMGPNGAGKTTLLRLLATLGRPQRGALRWFDSADPAVARRSLGLSLDSTPDDETLSGLQSAHLWCRQWIREPSRALALCEEALRRFGLAAVRHEPIATYSYGMRRRLALVEALAHEPRLALLDEPTAGLDPTGVHALAAELRRRAESGCATVVASNDANFAAMAASRVAFLVDGRLLRCAAPAELLAAVGGARVAELSVVDATGLDVRALRGLLGVERVDVQADDGVVTLRYHDPASLPRIVAVADHPGGRLRSMRLHEPDLADAFRELTGSPIHLDAR